MTTLLNKELRIKEVHCYLLIVNEVFLCSNWLWNKDVNSVLKDEKDDENKINK